MSYKGIIIEESLEDKSVLKKVKIVTTRVEKVTQEHQTPWLDKWTLHTVEVDENKADEIAEEIGKALDSEHDWYADFKNDYWDFIIYKNKVFKIKRDNKKGYSQASGYGISLGIPEYQLSFKSYIKEIE